MAVEQVQDEVNRPASTEKHDIEKVEQVSDGNSDTHPPGHLTTLNGESIEITWKTWFVIFVSARLNNTNN